MAKQRRINFVGAMHALAIAMVSHTAARAQAVPLPPPRPSNAQAWRGLEQLADSVRAQQVRKDLIGPAAQRRALAKIRVFLTGGRHRP